VYLSMFLGPNVSGPDDDRLAIELGIEQALKADEAGFAAIYLGEQHFNNYEPYSNPIVMAAYLAGRLKQAYLGTSMIPLPKHHPLMLVERINLLDQLTAGRCIIGMSSGLPIPDKAFPVRFPEGGAAQLFEEKLQVMLAAWAHRPGDGPMPFATSTESGVMPNRMMPYPYRAGHPLFAVGTSTESKIRAAGVAGRKVHTAGFDAAGGAALLGVYREGMEEGGIAPEVVEENLDWFIHTKVVFVGQTDDEATTTAQPLLLDRALPPWIFTPPEQEGMTLGELLDADPGPMASGMGKPESLAAFVQRAAIVGSPETVAAKLQQFDDVGLRHMHTRFVFGSLADVDPFRRSLDLFIDEVMPRLNVRSMPPLTPDQIRGVPVGV
jgi:alkanesulfonate monooxygenase SsuD/methylene tetrahydromethanopterin reductase-like flavin-dependent oxidoreductase (luciferase family)